MPRDSAIVHLLVCVRRGHIRRIWAKIMSSVVTLRRTRTLSRSRDSPATVSCPIGTKDSYAACPKLLTFQELPAWYQDNPWIRTGYRPILYSTWKCLQSLSYLHNETLNIFTHLIPALTIWTLPSYLIAKLDTNYPQATAADHFILLHNVLAATVTFALSAFYHTIMCHSPKVSMLCLRFDYIGILLLTHASFISGIYVGFFHHPHLQAVYWTMITIFALLTAVLVLHPRLQGLKWRGVKTAAFVATALSGFAPIGHGLLMYGWDVMWERSGMPWWLSEGAAYGTGVFFFASRFPESVTRWRGKFDVWGNSHTIFHLFVVLGAVLHLYGAFTAWVKNYEEAHGIRRR
jgi:adiponectin receptor